MVSTTQTSLLIRAMHRNTSSSIRRNKQTMARGKTISVISRRRAILKTHRRKLLEGSRKPAGQIVRKIQTLRRLVPGGGSTEIEDLFRAAADYILTLQMKVRVMEFVVTMIASDK